MNRVGRYEITELLGQGGMGTVYKAFDPLLARVVAVKVISTQLTTQPELRERFFREARAAAQLDHPNIITVYDLGEQDGAPYLAMQFLEGQDLEQRMRAPEGMSLGAKLEVSLAIASGLAHAHGSGVVHRDVKPANVFITTDGQVKILDFGLARLVTSELTRSNMMVGTVNYMAPEQLRSEKADHRADIFSLGVVLYELVGGKKPFQADSFASTMYKILEETPEPLERLAPALPPHLITIVDRAMAKAPENRYQSMADLVRDLDAAYEPLRLAGGTSAAKIGSALRTALGARPKSNPSAVAADPDAPTIVSPAPSSSSPAPHSPVPASSPPAPVSPAPTLPLRAPRPWRTVGIAGVVLVAAIFLLMLVRERGGPPPSSEATPGPTVASGSSRPSASPAPPPVDAQAPATASPLATEPAQPPRATGQPETQVRAAPEPRAGAIDGEKVSQALSALRTARAAAVAAGAPAAVPDLFAAADRQAAEARDARARGRLADAAARMDAATSLFETAGETARQQAEARAARAQAEEARRKVEPPQRPEPAAPVPAPAASQPAPAAPPPVASSRPPAQLPAVPPAAPLAAPPSQVPEPLDVPPETRVARDAAMALLGKYVDALEHRDIGALKAIWPGLGGRVQSALEAEFANATSITVSFDNPQVQLAGTRATVVGIRHYGLRTRDGQNLRSQTRTSLALRRSGSDWVIDSVSYEAAR